MTNESRFIASGPIVVGVDGSDVSAGALKHAAELASAFDTDLVAVLAWQKPPLYGGYLTSDWAPEDEFRHALEDTITSVFGSNPPDRLRTEIIQGTPAPVLVEASKNAQMLVVGRSRHGGFAGRSVSTACADHAECPVLVYNGTGIKVVRVKHLSKPPTRVHY
jgi:nucleotide-binding universal stress UspA family protein